MNLSRAMRNSLGLAIEMARQPRRSLQAQMSLESWLRGSSFASRWPGRPSTACEPGAEPEPAGTNPLEAYFDANLEGPGIWKWRHYFEIYDRYLAKFVGKPVHLVEVGIYSGGSMGMWRAYLGPQSHITGVDIEPITKAYENEFTDIRIGDQEDRGFWERFWAESSPVDILIDDGGHTPEQQAVTLEEVLPRLNPGGVYICEDVHGCRNRFSAFVDGLKDGLNHFAPEPGESSRSLRPTPLQAQIDSIHWYPFLVVIEKRSRHRSQLEAPRRGTEWQPFLK